MVREEARGTPATRSPHKRTLLPPPPSLSHDHPYSVGRLGMVLLPHTAQSTSIHLGARSMATETTPVTPTTTASTSTKAAATNQEVKEAIKAESKVEGAAAHAPTDISKVSRAEAIIKRNTLWSLGAGLLPFPVVDLFLASGVQLKMLKELSELYEVTFSNAIAKKIITSLVSSVGGVMIGASIGASLGKAIPGIGSALGLVLSPVTVGAFTYATGRVFLMHFESGGTFLDFDPHKMRKYFREEFEHAKDKVSQLHKDEQAKASAKPI